MMVSNFDSVVQAKVCGKLLGEGVKMHELWWSKGEKTFKTLLINEPDSCILSSFVGQLRTAYICSGQIILPAAQIMDGVFFLAFSPEEVLEMLGQPSYVKSSLVISGEQKSFREEVISKAQN